MRINSFLKINTFLQYNCHSAMLCLQYSSLGFLLFLQTNPSINIFINIQYILELLSVHLFVSSTGKTAFFSLDFFVTNLYHNVFPINFQLIRHYLLFLLYKSWNNFNNSNKETVCTVLGNLDYRLTRTPAYKHHIT